MTNKKFMLALSVPNTTSLKPDQTAFQTILAYDRALQKTSFADVSLAIEIEGHVSNPESLKELFAGQCWSNIWCWHQGTDDHARGHFPEVLRGFLLPGWSYGGPVNRFQLLAARFVFCAFCRIDPGCGVPDDLEQVLQRHLAVVQKDGIKIISGTYTGRPAIRVDFVEQEMLSAYKWLVAMATGIPVEAQITGGALFTAAVGAPPAIQFNGIRVWASDDGYFQQRLPQEWYLDTATKVPRSMPGKVMPSTEYLARVAGMVVLNSLGKGHSLPDATDQALHFLELVRYCIAEKYLCDYDATTAVGLLKAMAPGIEHGYRDYDMLKDAWPLLIKAIREVPDLESRCRVR